MISEVAKRYARALFAQSVESNSTERVFSELRELNSLLSSDQSFLEFLASPLVHLEKKIAALNAALLNQVSKDLHQFVILLAQKNRLSSFSEIVASFEAINDQAHGVTRGSVRSASSLGMEDRKKLEEEVMKVTQKKVILTYKEDAKILGGTIAQVGGWTFDDSLESHLTRLNDELNRRTL